MSTDWADARAIVAPAHRTPLVGIDPVTNVEDWDEASGVTVPLGAEDAAERANVVANFMAGLPTYDDTSKQAHAAGGGVYVPVVLVDVTSRYPGIETLGMGQLYNDPTYGRSGTALPITMAVGEYVTISGGFKVHWSGHAWASGPLYPEGDMTGRWSNVAAMADLATLKADPHVGDDGDRSPNDPYGPEEPWAPGSYLGLADLSLAYWDGEAWQAGKAPAVPARARLASGGQPGPWLPRRVPAPANEADLKAQPAIRSAQHPWNGGDWVETADGAKWHWDGSAWQTGVMPYPEVSKAAQFPTAAALANLAALKADPAIGDDPSAGQNPGNRPFNPGEFVATADGAKAYWVNGFVGWAAGVAPAPDGLDVTLGGTTAGGLADLTALKASASIGDAAGGDGRSAFTTGQYVLLTHDGLKNHWDGTAWQAGPA